VHTRVRSPLSWWESISKLLLKSPVPRRYSQYALSIPSGCANISVLLARNFPFKFQGTVTQPRNLHFRDICRSCDKSARILFLSSIVRHPTSMIRSAGDTSYRDQSMLGSVTSYDGVAVLPVSRRMPRRITLRSTFRSILVRGII